MFFVVYNQNRTVGEGKKNHGFILHEYSYQVSNLSSFSFVNTVNCHEVNGSFPPSLINCRTLSLQNVKQNNLSSLGSLALRQCSAEMESLKSRLLNSNCKYAGRKPMPYLPNFFIKHEVFHCTRSQAENMTDVNVASF